MIPNDPDLPWKEIVIAEGDEEMVLSDQSDKWAAGCPIFSRRLQCKRGNVSSLPRTDSRETYRSVERDKKI